MLLAHVIIKAMTCMYGLGLDSYLFILTFTLF
jgi:hypothetical protein